MEAAIPEWSEHWVSSGFQSGESIVSDLARQDASTNRFIMEPELAAVFARCRREGSILSAIMRNAWDGRPLEIRRRGDREILRHHHLGVLAHITPEEIRRTLPDTEAHNGFANRFLYVLTQRARILPFGGNMPLPRIEAIGHQLSEAIRAARGQSGIDFSPEARPLWKEFVEEVLARPRAGLVGAATARHRPQTLRLALIYALVEGAKELRPEHVRAAIAIWDYAEASAQIIFGNATGNRLADRLVPLLESAGKEGLTRTAMRRALGHDYRARELRTAVNALERLGLAVEGKVSGSGRSSIVTWASRHLPQTRVVPAERAEKEDRFRSRDASLPSLPRLGGHEAETAESPREAIVGPLDPRGDHPVDLAYEAARYAETGE